MPYLAVQQTICSRRRPRRRATQIRLERSRQIERWLEDLSHSGDLAGVTCRRVVGRPGRLIAVPAPGALDDRR